jgi:hypothetical protein
LRFLLYRDIWAQRPGCPGLAHFPSTMASHPVHSQVLWRWQGNFFLPLAPPSGWAVSLPTQAACPAFGCRNTRSHSFNVCFLQHHMGGGCPWGQPQGPEQTLDDLGGVRCQVERGAWHPCALPGCPIPAQTPEPSLCLSRWTRSSWEETSRKQKGGQR